MNKIVLNDKKIIDVITDGSIEYELLYNDSLGVNLLNISVIDSTDIELYYEFSGSKLEVCINVNPNVCLNVYEKVLGNEAKLRTKYYLKENSNVCVSKFNNIDSIKEYVVINLDGEGSSILYNLKTISIDLENYDILTYHNAKGTNSEIITNGVNIRDGKICFNVSSFIPRNMRKSVASQNNKIINLTDNECIIKPNLYIDEYDIVANHSAWIGSFNENELFYLQSRGIKRDEAVKLLIKGFLTSKLNMNEEQKNEIINIIDNYWR